MTPLCHSQPWHDRSHHAPDGGYRNVWAEPRAVPAMKAARWMLSRLFRSTPSTTPVQTPNLRLLASRPEALRLTWLGHSAVYLQTPTLDVLIDPMLGLRASPVRIAGPARAVPLPLLARDLPGVDLVLLSHDHYDHLDRGSIETLARLFGPRFLVPLSVDAILSDWGIRDVVAADWHQYVNLEGGRFHCVPARHFSGRGFHNRNGTLWAGWYLEFPLDVPTVYYAGDTAYAEHFVQIREHLGAPEVALMPIGAYAPRWFMRDVHIDPEEALQAFDDVGASRLIPIHWGTFDLSDEPIDEPPRRLLHLAEERGLTDRIDVLDVGGTIEFPHVVSRREAG